MYALGKLFFFENNNYSDVEGLGLYVHVYLFSEISDELDNLVCLSAF